MDVKVVADSLIHVPLIYLPLYYPFETVALGKGTVMDGVSTAIMQSKYG